MLTDLVLVPFGASLDEMLAAAQTADAGGFDTVWTYDHFSGLVQGAPWSRDPFVTLGAIAATTRADQRRRTRRQRRQPPSRPARLRGQFAAVVGARSCPARRGGRGGGEQRVVGGGQGDRAPGRPGGDAAGDPRRNDRCPARDVGRRAVRRRARTGRRDDGRDRRRGVCRRSSSGAANRQTLAIGCTTPTGSTCCPARISPSASGSLAGTPWPTRSRSARFCRSNPDHPLGGDPVRARRHRCRPPHAVHRLPVPTRCHRQHRCQAASVEPGERLTTDQREIDHRAVWQWLHDDSYWARGRPWAVQERAVAGSRCFAVIGPDGDTRAFCRLVTDGATFAWLADVVVLPPFRGRGLGKDLVAAVVGSQQDDRDPPPVARAPTTPTGSTAQFGFAPVETGFMERVVSDRARTRTGEGDAATDRGLGRTLRGALRWTRGRRR